MSSLNTKYIHLRRDPPPHHDLRRSRVSPPELYQSVDQESRGQGGADGNKRILLEFSHQLLVGCLLVLHAGSSIHGQLFVELEWKIRTVLPKDKTYAPSLTSIHSISST